MGLFLAGLIKLSLSMSIPILFLLIINELLADRISPSRRYYIWLIILAGLLIPFRANIQTPLMEIKPPEVFNTVNNTISYKEGDEKPAALSNVPLGYTGTNNPSPQEYNFLNFLVVNGAFVLWMIGAVSIFVFHIRSYIKFAKVIKRWGVKVGDAQSSSVIYELYEDMGIRNRDIKILSSEFVLSPMLIGFFKPTIVLPKRQFSPEEIKYIFKHELTHYKRLDLWVNLLVLCASAVHWFNPLVFYMAKAIRADCEASCDSSVVSGWDSNGRKRYGETIISFAGHRNKNARLALSTFFYGGVNSMKKRLASIMDANKKNKWVTVFSIVTVVLIITISGNVFASQTNSGQYIGEAKAKSIALAHAGVSEANISFLKTQLDHDDGYIIYDVEFYGGNIEYDYEIDATSGYIRESDKDIEYYKIPNSNTISTAAAKYISEEEAKSIALAHSGVLDSQATFIKTHLDYEDGQVVYDIEFYNGDTEHDYEIGALNGNIIKFDREIEYYSIQANSINTSNTPYLVNNNANNYIGEEKAKLIAIAHSGVPGAQIVLTKTKLDYDDGRVDYDIEFYYNNTEYEYEIDAISGQILEVDQDKKNNSNKNNSSQAQQQIINPAGYIGEEKAKSIALSNGGLTAQQINKIKVELDKEDGKMIYEVEFKNGQMEYEYEIDAVTGTILKSDIEYDD
ncbi:MAG: PepSY domain-containing protein [Clostridiales bacterium]|jgi:beta-lactamase regulating signal transducer with metallopeptidase domain/uncharacterized membrane protein YkoI|nr:PepSY domain-containing protein [Clostridiales bacterium]